ncbi:hypothetical protein BGX27_006171 [Mortierella sp. AM989]|nr:hypothetical protein BGX27_006171 [Mortierella sp. AM989]
MTETFRAPNPLDYPEILFAVGEHIPAFTLKSNNLLFTPKTLLDCCLVSKFWRDVLLPFVWREHHSILTERVPNEVFERHADLVRSYKFVPTHRSYGSKIPEPPIYTQLYEISIEGGLDALLVAKLIIANKNLRRLEVRNVRLGAALVPQSALDEVEGAESVSASEAKGMVVSPLGHLESMLQELTLQQMEFRGQELWRVLRPVSGNLWCLTLKNLYGSLDDIILEELMFSKVTHLNICMDSELQYRIEEIIGRCPVLERLELDGIRVDYPLDGLVHILQGTEEIETRKQKDKREKEGRIRKRWVRPQLATLRIVGPHGSPTVVANNSKILAAIQACSGYEAIKRNRKINQEEVDEDNDDTNDNDLNNGEVKGMGYRDKSLRELDVTLCVLDDAARMAIETHKLTLEVLKITIHDREGRASSIALERQGRVLRRLLRTCRHLRIFEFWDKNTDADVSLVLEEMVKCRSENSNNNNKYKVDDLNNSGRESDSGFSEDDEYAKERKARSEAWRNPALESLTIKATPYYHNGADMLDERRFNITTTTNDGESVDIEWVMPKQNWNPKTNDGSDALLGERWESFELFNEDFDNKNEGEGYKEEDTGGDDDLVQKFLKLVAPSQKLKTLQLGQLKMSR